MLKCGLFFSALVAVLILSPSAAQQTVWNRTVVGGSTAYYLQLSQTKKFLVVATDVDIEVFSAKPGLPLWNASYVDIQEELEGPFAFNDANGVVATVAPNSGTIATVWAVSLSNGTNLWNVYDDSSLDQQFVAQNTNLFYIISYTSSAVTALDPKTGAVVWKVALSDLAVTIVATDTGIFINYGSTAACLDPSTGKLVWNVTVESVMLGFMAVDEATKSAVFVAVADTNNDALGAGELYVFDAATGHVKVNNASVDVSTCAVAARNGVIYINSAKGLSGAKVTDGKVMWTVQTTLFMSPELIGSVAITTKTGADLTAYDGLTGKVVASYAFPAGYNVTTTPAAARNTDTAPEDSQETALETLVYAAVGGYTDGDFAMYVVAVMMVI
jgi:outer membrane protein assembly factor BamB